VTQCIEVLATTAPGAAPTCKLECRGFAHEPVAVGRYSADDKAPSVFQLAWQFFDLRVAQKLNLLGNEHTAKARELRLRETNGTPDEQIIQEAPSIGGIR